MQTRKAIVLTGMVVLLMASMVNMNAVVADTEPVGGGPGDDLEVFFLKKSFDFCDDGLDRKGPGSPDCADIPGGSVPDGFDVQSSGCVDNWNGKEQEREDNYAFTGEQIAELVVARDLDGAIAITHAIMKVDGSDVVYCNDVTEYYEECVDVALGPTSDSCGSFYGNAADGTVWWKGHQLIDADVDTGILAEYPPQKSESTSAGFDALYDKIYECFMTVTDDMDGSSVMTVEVTDTVNDLTAETPDQTWFFNPEVSLDISLSDGSAIEFEDGYAGDLVYSTNRLWLENAAEGGVDIAVWLGGTDLTSPDMAAKCPWSNILDVEGVDGWEGMQFRCNLDNGLYIEQTWQQVKNKDIKQSCGEVSDGGEVERCLGLNPLFYDIENVLENGHEADCGFKLEYPVPCIGSFTDGNLIILMRAI